jgi:hypothetical protein
MQRLPVSSGVDHYSEIKIKKKKENEMNTKLLTAITGLTIVMLLVSACGMVPTLGSRNLVSEPRNVTGYDRVEVSGGGSLDILQDGTESLTVETDDNIMLFVTSEVRGGTLFLGLDSNLHSLLPSRLHFTLHVKDMSGIKTSGSWDEPQNPSRPATWALHQRIRDRKSVV